MTAESHRGTAVGWEERLWDVAGSPAMSRRERADLSRPYRAAVPAVIEDLSPRLSGQVLADADEATIALSRFDAAMGGEIAPFSAVLLRSEAASSSQIENITASARAIAEAEMGARKGNAALVVGGVHAMTAAIAMADRLGEDAILGMHHALLAVADPVAAGRWRTEQVWIGGRASTPRSADFVPPHHDRVPACMADLVRFLVRDDLPVLVQVAIAHAQFETIHPFTDGNGRTGRALAHAMLRAKGVTTNVTVPVSAGLLADVSGYHQALTEFRRGDPAEMVTCLARASRVAVDRGERLVADLRDIRQGWEVRLSHLRRDSGARRLAAVLLQHPVIDSAAARTLTGSSNPDRDLRALVDAGILTRANNHALRNVLYRSSEVLSALDDYAAAMPRRSRS